VTGETVDRQTSHDGTDRTIQSVVWVKTLAPTTNKASARENGDELHHTAIF